MDLKLDGEAMREVAGLEGVNRAPHMGRYTGVRRYSTEEHRDGHQVTLTIGVQSFIISDGVGNHHESRGAAEWSRRQLCLALDTLRSEVIEECARVADELSDSASDHEAGAALHIAERIRALKGGVK